MNINRPVLKKVNWTRTCIPVVFLHSYSRSVSLLFWLQEILLKHSSFTQLTKARLILNALFQIRHVKVIAIQAGIIFKWIFYSDISYEYKRCFDWIHVFELTSLRDVDNWVLFCLWWSPGAKLVMASFGYKNGFHGKNREYKFDFCQETHFHSINPFDPGRLIFISLFKKKTSMLTDVPTKNNVYSRKTDGLKNAFKYYYSFYISH